LLAQHRAIVTAKETQLFTQYVNRLQERWREERQEAEARTTNGLTRVLTDEEFLDAIRALCDRVFHTVGRRNPEASFVLEKSPEHSLHADTILSLYPDSWFLHIIRDPRAVSNSFRHAARQWWSWAPSGPIETTRRWRKNILAGRRIRDLTSLYREVRYEDLLDNGETVLMDILGWLELECDLPFCRAALAACEIDKLKHVRGAAEQPWQLNAEPEGFFRSGEKESWRRELSARDVAIVEYEAGSLLTQLGYPPVTRAAARGGAPARVHLHDSLHRTQRFWRHLGHRIDWRITRLLSRM
jgi:hypothetical protein